MDTYCQEVLGSCSLQLSEHAIGFLSIDNDMLQYYTKQIVIACSHQGQTYCSSMAGLVLQQVSPQDCGSMVKLKNGKILLTLASVCSKRRSHSLHMIRRWLGHMFGNYFR